MAAAIVPARTVSHVFGGGNAAQFERFVDVFLNRILHLVQLFLRVKKAARDGIFQKRVAMLFKISDFLTFQRFAGMLFLVKRLSLAVDGFILVARIGVGGECVNAFADR